jgi:hypothetical protein
MQLQSGGPTLDASDLSPFVNIRAVGVHLVPAAALLGGERRCRRHKRQQYFQGRRNHLPSEDVDVQPCSVSDLPAQLIWRIAPTGVEESAPTSGHHSSSSDWIAAERQRDDGIAVP